MTVRTVQQSQVPSEHVRVALLGRSGDITCVRRLTSDLVNGLAVGQSVTWLGEDVQIARRLVRCKLSPLSTKHYHTLRRLYACLAWLTD